MRPADLLRRPGMLRDTLTLTGGGAAAQLLTLAAMPALSRLFSPADYGIYAVYAFLVAVPSALAAWSYEAAIPLPKDEDEARHLVGLALTAVCITTVAAILPLWYADAVAGALRAPALAPWLALVPLNVFAVGIYQVLSYWHNRHTAYQGLAASRVVMSGLTAGTQFAAGTAGSGVGGLIVGQILGQLAAPLSLWRQTVRLGVDPREVLRRTVLLPLLRQYRRFPLYTGWGTIMSVGAAQMIPVLLAWFFGPAEAGLFFFGYRLVSAAVALWTTSIGQVFYQRAARTLHEGQDLTAFVESMVVRLVRLFVLPCAAFAAVAPQFFTIVFGSAWTATGEYMRVITPLLFLQAVTAPVSLTLFLLEKNHVAALVQLALLVGAALSLGAAGVLHAGPRIAVLAYGTVQSVTYLVYLLIVLRAAGASPSRILRAATGLPRPRPAV